MKQYWDRIYYFKFTSIIMVLCCVLYLSSYLELLATQLNPVRQIFNVFVMNNTKTPGNRTHYITSNNMNIQPVLTINNSKQSFIKKINKPIPAVHINVTTTPSKVTATPIVGTTSSFQSKLFNDTKIKEKLDPSIKEVRKFNTSNILILIYTPFFGSEEWKYFAIKKDYLKECGYDFQGCELTYSNSRYQESDVVFFHSRDMPSSNTLYDLKSKAKSRQLWVYFTAENPLNSPPVSGALNELFELTSTYRYDSDMFRPYGSYVKLTDAEAVEAAKNDKKNYAEGKTKQIGWMVSHCGTLRDSLAFKFQQLGLNIEVGGSCRNKFNRQIKCGDRSCINELKKYKFIFSAENNLCNNYITEKYWRNPFAVEAIPITLGGSNYSDPRLAIPGSFINALDFNSPRELVEYIKKVDSNDTLYNQYFQWKKIYKLHKEKTYGCNIHLCKLCSDLKNGMKLRKNALVTNIDIARECNAAEQYFKIWINK